MANASEDTRRPGFTTWLKSQVHRRDLVGDLADDVLHDPDWPKYITASQNGYEKVWQYFTDEGACEGAWDGFDQAWHEWRSLDPDYDGVAPSWRDYEPEWYGDIIGGSAESYTGLGEDVVRSLEPDDRPFNDRERKILSEAGFDHVLDDLYGRPCTLYRFFSNTELLYIGISVRPVDRISAHQQVQPWWTEVTTANFEHHPSRSSALRAEREAITAECPKYNVVHNERNGLIGVGVER